MTDTPTIKLTEDIVANALYQWRCGPAGTHWTACTRCHLFAYESDFLSVRGDFAHDHEIKLTKSDYRSELTKHSKKAKHFWLRAAFNKEQPARIGTRDPQHYCPNFYWFVTPKGMLKKGDPFPHYAGLIEFQWSEPTEWHSSKLVFTIRRKAPQLHKAKLTDSHFRQLSRALMFRFFNARAKLVGGFH